MKSFPLLLLLWLGGPGFLPAQKTDLGKSYYHFSRAKLHDLRKEYSEAIAEFEKALSYNSGSAQLYVEFARTLWEAGEVRRAVEVCEKARELEPQNAEPHFLLGQIYLSYREGGGDNMVEKALHAFDRVVELEPETSEHHRQALYSLGRLHLLKKNYRVAADLFARLVRLQPGFVQGYYFKALAHIELNEMQPAIEALNESLRYRADNAENLKLLGSLYEGTQQYEKALEVYSQALQYSSDPEIRHKLGRLLSSEKRFEEAIPILRDLAEQSPQNIEIRLELGKALREQKKYSEAAEVFYAALRIDSDQVEVNYELARTLERLGERLQALNKIQYLLKITESADGNYAPGQRQNRTLFKEHLGLLYQETRQYQKAVETFQEVARENPDQHVAQLRLIYALKDAARLPEALSLSERLVKEYPEEPLVVIARAQMLSHASKLDQGMELLRREIRRKPDEEQFYVAASQLYLDHKKFREAEKIIRTGLARKPESVPLQFQLGATFERQKEFQRAEEIFKQILQKDSNHAGVLNYLGYMLADLDIRLQEALAYIKKAVEIDPYNGAYLDSLGWAYFKLSELELAEIHLVKAAQLNDADATIYDHLGDLYFRLGQYDKARQYYQKSILWAQEEEEHKRVREKLADLNKLLTEKR